MTNDELIKALRWCADESICCDDFSGEKCPYCDVRKDSCSVDDILHDAADAIERLMAEIDRKDKSIQGLLTQIESNDKTIERMRNLMKHYKAAYRTAYKLYQEARNGN